MRESFWSVTDSDCNLASSVNVVGHKCYMNIVGVTLSRCFNFQTLHLRISEDKMQKSNRYRLLGTDSKEKGRTKSGYL